MVTVKPKRIFRGILFTLGLVIIGGITSSTLFKDSLSPKTAAQTTRPNVVVIMTDDQDVDSLPVMRKLMSYPEGSWIKFTNAFVNHSLCCPARSTFLSGQYSSVHGVTQNDFAKYFDDTNTLATWLKNDGYTTALRGKYLNQFPWDKGANYIPPGWDEFRATGDVDSSSQYAVDYITNASDTPFFLFISYTAPHEPAQPPARYADADVYIPADRPNYNEADVSDKQEWIRNTTLTQETLDKFRLERIASQRELLAVDDGIQSVVDSLKAKGKLDNTMIIFLSDHGWSWGSHRIFNKHCIYEECHQIPLFIRFPGQTGNREENRFVSMVDLAATISEYTGVTPTRTQNGKSFLSLLTNTPGISWDDATLLESGKYYGVRVPGWKYVEYRSSKFKEMYDLTNDPYELQNIANQPAYQQKQAELVQKLQELKLPFATITPTPRPSSTPGASVTPTPTVKPQVSISNLSEGDLLKDNKIVKVTVLDPQGVGINSVDVFIDGTPLGSVYASPYSVSWNTRTSSDGAYTITAAANYVNDVTIYANPVNVTVDNTAPVISFTSPQAGTTVSGSVIFSGSATDVNGIKTVKFFVDNVLQESITTGSFSFTWNSASVSNGKRNLRINAQDSLGNVGSSTVQVIVAN